MGTFCSAFVEMTAFHDSVYGERKFVGLHPRSAQEMAFDVVTPAPASPLADAEVQINLKNAREPLRKSLDWTELRFTGVLLSFTGFY